MDAERREQIERWITAADNGEVTMYYRRPSVFTEWGLFALTDMCRELLAEIDRLNERHICGNQGYIRMAGGVICKECGHYYAFVTAPSTHHRPGQPEDVPDQRHKQQDVGVPEERRDQDQRNTE